MRASCKKALPPQYNIIYISATLDVGRDDGLGSQRNPAGVTLKKNVFITRMIQRNGPGV